MNLTKNFTKEEMACKHCGQCKMDDGFMKKIQELRDSWGRPIRITSGYRCETHNKAVGGKPDSQHLKGIAADIDVSGMTGNERFWFLDMAMSLGFRGIGIDKNFLHLDYRSSSASLWVY